MVMDVEEMFDAYQQVLMNGFVPEVMVIAYPEGTWLLRLGEEPKLLGEKKEFEPIMLGMLGIRNFGL